MFLMMRARLKHRKLFSALCNMPESAQALSGISFSNAEWDKVKYIRKFFRKAFRFTHITIGSSYVTISFLPLIYDAISAQCL